jgi:PhnB protein
MAGCLKNVAFFQFQGHRISYFYSKNMKNLKIPEGYQQLMPYLIVKDAAGFLNFMQKVFGAVEKHKHMRTESLIMHAEIKIGDSVIMFADSTDQFAPRTAGLFLYVSDADETFKTALAEGATVVMEMADQTYGRSGGVLDPFGNTWWLTTNNQ